MHAEVDICNIALGRIGIDRTVTNLDSEQSKEARNCRRFYPLARDMTIERAPWPFLVATVALAQISDNQDADLLPGWGYQYAEPVDMASLLEVVPADDVTAAVGYYSNCACDAWNPCRKSPYPFRRALSTDANRAVILTPLEDAYAVYVRRVTNTAIFTATMVSLIADRLAAELAGPMSGNPQLAQACLQRYEVAFIDAVQRQYEQERHGPSANPPSVDARA